MKINSLFMKINAAFRKENEKKAAETLVKGKKVVSLWRFLIPSRNELRKEDILHAEQREEPEVRLLHQERRAAGVA